MPVLELAPEPADDPVKRSPAAVEYGSEIDLRDLLRVLWRGKMTIAGTVFLLTALAAIVLFQVTPRYTSSVLVIIDPRETQFVEMEAVLSGLPGDLETIQSETEIIKSRSLADKVVRKLNLYDDPEFNPRLRPETFLDSAASVVGDWAGSVFPGPEKQAVPLEDQFDMERVGIIDNFAEKLEVGRRGRSRVIEIAFESEEPRTAVLVANTIADLYLVEQLEAKFEMTQRATLWLNDRMSELRKEVKASELAVEVFRAKAGLVEGEHASLAAQQISELSTQLVLARSARAEADARLRQVRSLLNSANGVDSVAEVLSSPLIQRLREQEAEVERKIAELLTEYGDKHPRMINIRAEMRDLRAKITSEVNKIVQNLRGEVSVVRARENSLQSSLDKLKQRVGSLNSSEVQLRALQREANANRDLYETFLSRFKETSNQQEMQQSDGRIIARADLPREPSFPKKRLIFALVFVGSVFLGVVLVFAIEQLDHGFRSMEQIENITGIPSIGMVPAVGKSKGRPEKYAVENPTSILG
ncbi:MAG: GumC family protein, partial [Alphaproteobacteria bacterium]|nr:GumC family protein [Alphaproteobacteria bacterium]